MVAVATLLEEQKLTGLCIYAVVGGCWVASIERAGRWIDSKVCEDADEALRQVLAPEPTAMPWVTKEKMPWE